jgi:NarL family two-component system sensor histidine kinase YdfH
VFGLTRFAALGVLGYILLTALSFYVLGGTAVLDDWLQPTASTFTLLIIFMVLYRRQLDARDRSQELLAELKDANHQLSKYAAQVETLTLATERQRMARELHDTLAQGVAGLILQLEAANAHLENGNVPRAQTIIQHSMKRARSTLADARAAIDDLRLDNSSLADTILRHTDRFTRATGIPCHLTLELNPEEDISSTVVDHADRIIGESLANITRHAQANAAWVVVQQSAENLTIDIRDDGVGFDLVSAEKAGHYGLLGIRERTRLVNGTFEIDSNTHDGTHLTITLPLEAT